MFRYSDTIYRSVENHLSEQGIPYRSYVRFGLIRFSACLDGGEAQYDFRINVFDRGFWVEVPVPVPLPWTEKVNTRMAKFCCRVNLTDHTGGFLVPDPEKETLVYRLRVCCDGDPDWRTGEGLTAAPQMVRHYRDVTERLAAGKLSVEEALRVLDKDLHHLHYARLMPPVPKEKPLSLEQLELRQQMQEALESWIRSQKETEDRI